MLRASSLVASLAIALGACAAPTTSRPRVAERTLATDPQPRAPIADPACEQVDLPPFPGVVVLARGQLAAALAPAIHAACVCSRPGERVHVDVVILPEAGRAIATAPDDEPTNACMQQASNGAFTPFEIGSDCIDCGPKAYGILRGAARARPRTSRIHYPLTFLHVM